LYKEQELEKVGNIIKRSKEDLGDIGDSISEISEELEEKESLLEVREAEEQKLNERFKKMFAERDDLQKSIGEKNLTLNEIQNEVRGVEEQINYLKVGKAKLDAERESIEIELSDYSGVELLKGSLEVLEERLAKASEALSRIGSINMRALEVYESVKEEYDRVYEKVQTLESEKIEILKIIEEIDKKKSRTFMRTFRAINDLFSSNFSKLYTKGTAYLEVENKEDIFAGGVNIVVKLAKGKYFDITSLSGGEKTLVALALLFSIQEHKPYHFYIFDEIDAALDKRNSERLAGLLNQYMKAGQYIVITHNDAIIMNSNLLYGVSMQDGASKVLSLKVD
jgi:chromosome segregation protein